MCLNPTEVNLSFAMIVITFYWGKPEQAPHLRDIIASMRVYVYLLACLDRPLTEILNQGISLARAQFKVFIHSAISHFWSLVSTPLVYL